MSTSRREFLEFLGVAAAVAGAGQVAEAAAAGIGTFIRARDFFAG